MTFLAQHLWSDVVGSAAQGLLPLSVIVDLGGQTKVSNLAIHVVIKEDVAQLEITVNDLVLVEVEDTKENLLHEVPCLRFCDRLSPLVQLHQAPTDRRIMSEQYYLSRIFVLPLSTNLQNDVYVMVVFKVGVKFHKVGVGNTLVQSDLLRHFLPTAKIMFSLNTKASESLQNFTFGDSSEEETWEQSSLP